MEKRCAIALDGPSGAGKSTIARAVAKRYGFVYVDTGAIYRTVGLAVCRAGIGSKDAEKVAALLPQLEIEFSYNDAGEQRMYLNGEDVSTEIRRPEISIYASDVSAIPAVRAFLLDMQRAMARKHNVVMDGRDIGTVVLPDAGLKIFITAEAETRARRREKELLQKGMPCDFAEVLRDIQYRDHNDATRADAPLRRAEDAVLLDTTELDFDESVEAVSQLIKERFSL